MDSTSLLIKLNELIPWATWSYDAGDGFLANYIIGSTNPEHIDVKLFVEPYPEDNVYELTMISSGVNMCRVGPDIEVLVQSVMKTGINCAMARWFYRDKESYDRWLKSVNKIQQS